MSNKKIFYIQTYKRSGRSIEFFEDELKSKNEEEAMLKAEKKYTARVIVGIRQEGDGRPDLRQKINEMRGA